jgi:hypothetical protein
LNFDFFEKIRTKRNGINYYGTPLTQEDWKSIEMNFTLYYNLIKQSIEKKIEEYEKNEIE